MKLEDILSVGQLVEEIDAGYVTERYHPEFGELAILNYTDKCQFDGRWNDVTKVARGLIYNRRTGEIVARGLPKFCNCGYAAHTGQLDPDMPILSAHDKVDGSLGIGYMRPDGRAAIATRGSFVSEQALHANEILAREQVHEIELSARLDETPIWEIVYPENRIVLDYGDRDELVPLGVVFNASGRFIPAWHGADIIGGTLRGVLEREPRKNAEGYVIWLSPTQAVKLKQRDYMELHRIVSNLTVKEVWRQLRDGTFEEFAAALPDEFHDWAKRERDEQVYLFEWTAGKAVDWLSHMPTLTKRKDQAIWIQDYVPDRYRGLVFNLLDNKDLAPAIWRMIEPKMTNNREEN
jgi:RNA ligase